MAGGNLGNIYVGIRAKVDKFKNDLRSAHVASTSSSRTLQRNFDGLNFNKARSSLLSFNKLLVAGFAGYGLKQIASTFIDAANTTEQYRLRLNALLGDVDEGGRVFKEMAEFAGKVPYEFEEIMSSATQLSGVMRGGVDEIKMWMPIIADLAAVSGLGIQQTTEQVVRMYSAGAASADLFRERGITAMLGFQAKVSYSAEETRKRLIEAWEDPASKFRGATTELSKTWSGTLSMISDKWFKFRNVVMDAGAYDAIKSGIGEVNKRLGEWIEKNETLIAQKLPIYVKATTDTVIKLAEAISDIISWYEKHNMVIQNAYDKVIALGEAMNIFFGGSGKLAGDWVKITKDAVDKYEHEVERIRRLNTTTPEGLEQITDWSTWGKEEKKQQAASKTKPKPSFSIDEKAVKKAQKEYEDRIKRYTEARKSDLELLDIGMFGGEPDPVIESNEKTILALTDMWAVFNDEQTQAASAASIAKAKALEEISKNSFSVMTELSERTAWAMQENFSTFFFSAMKGELTSFKDFAVSIFDTVLKAFADMAAQMAVQKLFGVALGAFGGSAGAAAGSYGMTGAIVTHGGGVVGTPKPKRSVPSWMFNGAPRLHGGLAGDEFPAILQRGETVIPKNGNSGGGMTSNVNINISATDAASFADMTSRNPEAIIYPIMKGIQEGNMPLIRALRGAM